MSTLTAHRFLALLLVVAAATPTAAAGDGGPTGLLLRVRSTVELAGIGLADTLVYRDGLVVAARRDGAQVSFLRGAATAEQLAALHAALAANQVGRQRADHCDAGNLSPATGPYAMALTWFGRDARQVRLLLVSSGIAECADEVQEIALAVQGFLAGVGFSDVTVTTP